MKYIILLLWPFYLPFYLIERWRARKYRDEQFGTFIHDSFIDTFTASVQWKQKHWVAITVPATEEGPAPGTLELARTIWADLEEWDQKCKLQSAKENLEDCNDMWRDPGVAEYTVQDFQQRMKLVEIEIDGTGSFQFWYADGGLFKGHQFLVWVKEDHSILRVDVAG